MTRSPSVQLKLHPGEVFKPWEQSCLQSDVLTDFTHWLHSPAKLLELYSASDETTASGKVVITFTATSQFRIYCLKLLQIVNTVKSVVLQLKKNFTYDFQINMFLIMIFKSKCNTWWAYLTALYISRKSKGEKLQRRPVVLLISILH